MTDTLFDEIEARGLKWEWSLILEGGVAIGGDEAPLVSFNIRPATARGESGWYIGAVMSHGPGGGNLVMELLTHWADAEGHRLSLTVDALRGQRFRKGRGASWLRAWYKHWGFKFKPRSNYGVREAA